MDESDSRTQPKRDWLIALGIFVTIVWVMGGVIYVGYTGLAVLLDEGADTIGGFLEGFFAPLAFLWLVIGLFIQQRELATNTKVLKDTQLVTEQQTRVLAETELRARQSAFFQIADNVRRQTGNLAGMLLESLVDDNGERLVSVEDTLSHWDDHLNGQYERFPALLVKVGPNPNDFGMSQYELFFGTEKRRGFSEEYIRSFRELLRLGRECDPDGTIVRTTTQTPHGSLYESMLESLPAESYWVFLNSNTPFVQLDENESFVGEWLLKLATVDGVDEVRTTIWETEEGYQAKTESKDGLVEHTEVRVFRSVLFIRMQILSYCLILTATIDEDVVKGSIDNREGIYATFTGHRVT